MFISLILRYEHAVHGGVWRSANGHRTVIIIIIITWSEHYRITSHSHTDCVQTKKYQFIKRALNTLLPYTYSYSTLRNRFNASGVQSRSCSGVILSKFIVKSFFHV